VPGSLNKKGGKRWNLGSIFYHSAFFGFISQRWNPFLRREKSRKKLQSEKSVPISSFLAPFFTVTNSQQIKITNIF
jgi:hypothetical protein